MIVVQTRQNKESSALTAFSLSLNGYSHVIVAIFDFIYSEMLLPYCQIIRCMLLPVIFVTDPPPTPFSFFGCVVHSHRTTRGLERVSLSIITIIIFTLIFLYPASVLSYWIRSNLFSPHIFPIPQSSFPSVK